MHYSAIQRVIGNKVLIGHLEFAAKYQCILPSTNMQSGRSRPKSESSLTF